MKDKNAGDNLILGFEDSIDNLCDRVAENILKKNHVRSGCEDSKCDEWPCVGDEVVFTDLLQHYDQYRDDYCNKVSKVIARFNSVEGEFITVHREYCSVMTVRVDRVLQDGALIKPKTPEEELRDELVNDLSSMQRESNGYTVDSLMSKYNITKKPQ